MAHLLLNTIALDPYRWTPEKVAYYRLDALLEPIARAGFRFVEVWQFHVFREDEAAVRQLREKADALGLRFPVVGLYPHLHLDGAARRDAWADVEKMMAFAGILGAEVVKCFVGSKGSAAVTEAEYERSIAFLHDMARLARSHGLVLTGETHPDTLFDTLDACRNVLDAVGDPTFKVCFQPYDLADTRQALADYATLHEHVVHVHYQGRRDGRMVLLQDAALDYDALTGALAAHGFDGHLCIEFVKDCVVEDAAHFDLYRVLHHARLDRAHVLKAAARCGMAMAG